MTVELTLRVDGMTCGDCRARVAGREVLVGSARFLEGRGIDRAAAAAPRAGLEADGETAVLAAAAMIVSSVLVVADSLRLRRFA